MNDNPSRETTPENKNILTISQINISPSPLVHPLGAFNEGNIKPIKVQKRSVIVLSRQNLHYPAETVTKNHDKTASSKLLPKSSYSCDFHLADQNKSLSAFIGITLINETNQIINTNTKLSTPKRVFVRGYSQEKVNRGDKIEPKSSKINLFLTGLNCYESNTPNKPTSTASKDSWETTPFSQSVPKFSNRIFTSVGINLENLVSQKEKSPFLPENKTSEEKISGLMELSLTKRVGDLSNPQASNNLKSPHSKIRINSFQKPGTPKKHCNKLATILNLAKQNKRKNQLVSLIYQQYNREESASTSIRVPNKEEKFKLDKEKAKEHKKRLKILGSNSFELLKPKAMRTTPYCKLNKSNK